MKLFLKSIAFFASFAILFTACSDDDTTDAGGGSPTPKVESSTISSALPGNGKLQVVWNVPYDDNITTTRVSWAGTATNYVDCSLKYLSAELTATELEEQIAELELDDVVFGDDYITFTKTLTLAAGTYTISVESLGSVELDTEATVYESDVVVYDSSTYSNHPEVAQIAYDGTNAYITWGEVPADLIKVIIGYDKDSTDEEFDNSKSSIRVTTINEGGLVELEGAKKDSYYTMTSYFLPSVNISEDEFVTLSETDFSRQIPQSETAAAAPTNVTIQPGVGRIKVTWSVPVGTTTSVVSVTGENDGVIGGNITLTSGAGLNVGSDVENVLYIYSYNTPYYDTDGSNDGGLAADVYTVSIINKYDSDNTESESVTGVADVYTATSYAGYVPTAEGQYADNVVVTWTNTSASDLVSTTVNYGTYSYITEAGNLSGGTEFDYNSTPGKAFSYTSTFAPEGGFEELEVETSNQELVAAATVDLWYDSGNSRYYVYTAKGLKAFADLVNGNSNTCGAMLSNMAHSFGTANVSIEGRIDSSTVSEIDLSDLGANVSWEPISGYTGYFAGASVPIKNLYIKTTSSQQGLFGSTSGATIDRVILVDPVVKVYDNGTVGALIGYAAGGTKISNCYVKNTSGNAEVSINTSYGSAKAVLGSIVGQLVSSRISNCHNEGVPVINQSSGTNTTGGLIGNVTGDTDLTDTTDAASYIVNCSTTGTITAPGNNVGGLVGYAGGFSYYVGCFNSGDITAGAYVGGLIGYVVGQTKIAACYNTGNISTTSHYLGGLTGRIAAVSIDVVSCFNTGSIYTTYSTTNTQATGCIVGVDGLVSNSVYTQYLELYTSYYIYAGSDYFDQAIGSANASVQAVVVSDAEKGAERLTTSSALLGKVNTMNTTLNEQYNTGGALNGYATSSTSYAVTTKYGFAITSGSDYPTISSSYTVSD